MVYFPGKLCNKSLSYRDVPAENVFWFFFFPFLLTSGKTKHYFLSPSNKFQQFKLVSDETMYSPGGVSIF